ncbi:MAG: hypothetical protein TRG1_1266 [Flavobacteriaceae bacterium FS1-H7996/R]|nr:MAG: hypothetical protein TRG1_1266 [Flavobacteriaceae bacterium FS1-H7996/R]
MDWINQGEYVRGRVSINTIEHFYVGEFVFRYKTRFMK